MAKNLLRIKLFIGIILFLVTASCKRNEDEMISPPVENTVKMKYKDLDNVQVNFLKSFSCDVDNDGKNDFYILSQLIGKPSEQSDYHSYYFSSSIGTYCPIDDNEQTPVLNSGDVIGKDVFKNHEWYDIVQTTLAEKVIPMSGISFWTGKWMNASNKYLTFAIEKNKERYYGWVEISFSQTSEAVILHRAAIAEEPGKNIFAGK